MKPAKKTPRDKEPNRYNLLTLSEVELHDAIEAGNYKYWNHPHSYVCGSLPDEIYKSVKRAAIKAEKGGESDFNHAGKASGLA